MHLDPSQSQPALPAIVIAASRRAAATRERTNRLSPAEQSVVRLTAATWRHDRAAASLMQHQAVSHGVEPHQLDQIRWGGYAGDHRIDALVAATRLILRQDGRLDPDDRSALNTLGVDAQSRHETAQIIGITLA